MSHTGALSACPAPLLRSDNPIKRRSSLRAIFSQEPISRRLCSLGLLLSIGALGSLGCKSTSGPTLERITSSGVQCNTTDIACGNECIAYQEDPAHCGGCGIACGADEICNLGGCVPAAQGCSDSLLVCDAGCRNTDTSQEHCGECNNGCPSEGECSAGQCECPDLLTVCGAECSDLQSSETDCGQCGISCSDTQTCEQGSCECPSEETLCDTLCTDTTTSTDHCGQCGNACIGGQLCGEGNCACPDSGELCDDSCTNTQTDAVHCGACGNACTGGQICGEGECVCPPGQALCDDQCIDILDDNDNCGACEVTCGLGDGCQIGQCQSGLLGSDDCQGLAQDIVIEEIAAYQTVKVQLMSGGELSETPISTLVAGRDTLVRFFIQPQENWEPREISARLHIDSGQLLDLETDEDVEPDNVVPDSVAPDASPTDTGDAAPGEGDTEDVVDPISVRYSTVKLSPAAASTEPDRESAFEFLVPGNLITTGSRFSAELVECGQAITFETSPTNDSSTEGSSSPTQTEEQTNNLPLAQQAPLAIDVPGSRYPSADGSSFEAVDTGTLRVHLLPFIANGRLADTSEELLDFYKSAFLLTYPTANVELTVGEPVEIDDPQDWDQTLNAARIRRQQDAPDDDVYYYGLVQPTERFGQFCGGGCVAGVGYVVGAQRFDPRLIVSVGLSYGDSNSAFTMLHEVGHNHGRGHAPCVPQGGNITGVDDGYPHDGGAIGVTGYLASGDQLLPATAASDLMGYCNNQWLSDYTYNALFDRITALNAALSTQTVDVARIGHWRVALLSDTRGTRWGASADGETTAAGEAEQAIALDAAGAEIESVTVYRTQIGDWGSSVDVPEPEPGWAAIVIDGAEQLNF